MRKTKTEMGKKERSTQQGEIKAITRTNKDP